jgi:pSer/pThr/pTyr-binding forkhead associated (FHA) protein
MIELRLLSGNRKGECISARPPLVVGRSPTSGLCLPEPGVWESHAIIECGSDGRLHLKAAGGGLVSVDSKPVRDIVLRSGDRIELGSVTLEFRLSPSNQPGLNGPERMLWSLLAGAALLQLALLALLAGT